MGTISLSADVESLLNLNAPPLRSTLSKGVDSGNYFFSWCFKSIIFYFFLGGGSRQSALDDQASAGSQFIDQLLADVIQEAPENSFSKQWQQAFGLGKSYFFLPIFSCNSKIFYFRRQLFCRRTRTGQC